MKKSQISMVIVLGLVLVIVVFLLFGLRSAVDQRVIDRALEDSVPIANAFEKHFRQCVNYHLDVTLDQIFQQGGVIYMDQGGPFRRSQIISTIINGLTVTHGVISATSYSVPKSFSPINNQINSLYDFSTGLFFQDFIVNQPPFGQVKLPKLCNRNGPNPSNVTNTSRSCVGMLYNFLGNDVESVQSQLNHLLSSKVIQCLEDAPITQRYTLNQTGDGGVSVIFGDEDITLDINLTVSYQENNVEYFFNGLNYSFPYRVKRLYSLGYLMASFDIRNIFFDIDNRTKVQFLPPCTYTGSTPCLDNLIDIDIQRINDTSGKYSIVTLRDRGTKLENLWRSRNNNYLELVFIIENRRPYLEYIADIDAIGGVPKAILLEVWDPDEDVSVILAQGWNEIKRTVVSGTPKAPEYFSASYVWTPLSSSDSNAAGEHLVDKLQSVPIGQMITLNCQEYCLPRPGVSFYETRYFMTAKVWDGQDFDFQDFVITIKP